MNILTFNEVEFQPVKQQNQIWLTSNELAKALGYAETDSVTKLYNRHIDEFKPSMTQVIDISETVKLTAPKNQQNLVKKVRIFNLRGCHLVAMFAKTKVAKEFRQWVLDILDKEVGEPVQVKPKLTSDDTLPLRNAVSMATGILRLDYATIYKMVHQRFGVDEIKDLTNEQVEQAVEYVHGLVLQHGRKPVDNAMLYDVLANSAVHLRDYVRLIKQLKGIMFFDDDMGRNVHDFVVNNVRDIAQIAHDMKLTNKYGKPMFEPNRINYYGGNAIIMN